MLTAYCTADGTQQVFPNGAASLQFYMSQSVALDGSKQRYRTVLYHQNKNKVSLDTDEGPFVVFGVEFVPFCSRLFFATCLLEKLYFTPEELQDEGFAALSRSIHEADGAEERVKLLDDFFMERLSRIPADDVNLERLNDVFDEIVPTDGSVARPPKSQGRLLS